MDPRANVIPSHLWNAESRKPVEYSLKQLTNNTEARVEEETEYSDPEMSDDSEDVQLDDSQQLTGMTDLILLQALEEEKLQSVSCDQFQRIQTEFRPRHREIAVKWLLQLNSRFAFSRDTIYNAVIYFDNAAMQIAIPRGQIQCYAIACFCLSVKIDLRTTPTIRQLVELTGEQFTAGLLAEKELEVLRALSFRLSYGTIVFHMRIYSQLIDRSSYLDRLAELLAELALMKFEFLDYRPSIVAVGVFVLSALALGMVVKHTK
jgi:cyclin B